MPPVTIDRVSLRQVNLPPKVLRTDAIRGDDVRVAYTWLRHEAAPDRLLLLCQLSQGEKRVGELEEEVRRLRQQLEWLTNEFEAFRKQFQ